jgi:hypothetical protein
MPLVTSRFAGVLGVAPTMRAWSRGPTIPALWSSRTAARFVVAACGTRRPPVSNRSSGCTSWLAGPDPSVGSTAGCGGPTSAPLHPRRTRSPPSRRRTRALRRNGSRSHVGEGLAEPGQLWLRLRCWPAFRAPTLWPGCDAGTTPAPWKCPGNDGGLARSRERSMTGEPRRRTPGDDPEWRPPPRTSSRRARNRLGTSHDRSPEDHQMADSGPLLTGIGHADPAIIPRLRRPDVPDRPGQPLDLDACAGHGSMIRIRPPRRIVPGSQRAWDLGPRLTRTGGPLPPGGRQVEIAGSARNPSRRGERNDAPGSTDHARARAPVP